MSEHEITYRLISPDEVADLAETIADEVEGWFLDQPLRTDDFLDRLERTLMTSHGVHLGGDLEAPAIKAIMKIARQAKRELSNL